MSLRRHPIFFHLNPKHTIMRRASYNQIQRYHDALVNLKSMSGEVFTQRDFSKAHHVSKEFMRACIELGIINRQGRSYHWISDEPITLYTADEVRERIVHIKMPKKSKRKYLQSMAKKSYAEVKIKPKKSPAPRKRRKVTPPKKREISILWGMFTIKY